MTEKQILERIAELKAQADQLRANLNAVGGAIQDCEYWLEQLKSSPRSENKDAPNSDSNN